MFVFPSPSTALSLKRREGNGLEEKVLHPVFLWSPGHSSVEEFSVPGSDCLGCLRTRICTKTSSTGTPKYNGEIEKYSVLLEKKIIWSVGLEKKNSSDFKDLSVK
jgi:hypothetical protein